MSDIILRGEDALPDDLVTLLHEPPSDGVWHVSGHPSSMDLGLTQRVARTLRAVTGWVLQTPQPDELEGGDRRFGLWLTEENLLLADDQGARAIRREDIVSLRARRVRRLGQRTRDLLVFKLSKGRVYFSVDSLDGWAGRAGELRAELDRRLNLGRTRACALEEFAANRQFDGFVVWLDTEARRLQPDPAARAQLLELTAVALSSWPDETRRASPDWFLVGEPDSSGRRRFARDESSWLLPLSRSVTFEAANHFPDATSVADCALTFRNVPLTAIELDGSLADGPFEALLIWAATKPLRALAMSEATASQQARLADFKRRHGIA